MSEANFKPSDLGADGAAWAAAFVKAFPGIDEGTMISWFCNAIEIACEKRGKDQATEIERLKAELDGTVEMFHREVAARIKLEAERDNAKAYLAEAVDMELKTQAQLATMQTALEAHHEWHQRLGVVGLEGVEVDMSFEYSDSPLFAQTMRALQDGAAVTKILEAACRYARHKIALDDFDGDRRGIAEHVYQAEQDLLIAYRAEGQDDG